MFYLNGQCHWADYGYIDRGDYNAALAYIEKMLDQKKYPNLVLIEFIDYTDYNNYTSNTGMISLNISPRKIYQ